MFKCRDGTQETNSHWDWQELGKPLLGVDFHHTITTKCGACPTEKYGLLSAGEPQKGVSKALNILSKTFKIIIYTGYGCVASEKGNAKQEIIDYLNKYDIPFNEIIQKPYPFAFMIDDRAIHHTSWNHTLEEIRQRTSNNSKNQSSLLNPIKETEK